jgi:hypothetical protein
MSDHDNASNMTPGPASDLIDHAAKIIIEARKDPHTAPGHWAGALWQAGMLVGPGEGSDWLAAHDAALRERIAQEVRTVADENRYARTKAGRVYAARLDRLAVRIARTGGEA